MEENNSVVDRMYKRNAQRIDLLDKQRKLREEVIVSNEQLDYFTNVFKEKSDSIESALNDVESLKNIDIATHFEKIKKSLHELQNFVAESSFFLKEYNIRKSHGVIQNLQTRAIELENIYIPKKKFGFRNKGITKKNVEIIKVCPDIVDNAPAEKKKWNVVLCGFTDVSDATLTLSRDEVLKKDVSLSNLTDCIVIIRGSPATLHMDNITNSYILCGPVGTSVFMDKCTDCVLVLACQQLRCHSSINCNVYLHVTSKAIIEDCNRIEVAPYNLHYDGINDDFSISSLDLNKNNWDTLDDFNWLAADVASPNWKVMDQDIRITNWSTYMK